MMKELSLVRSTILTKMQNKTTESKESESSNHLMKRGKRGRTRVMQVKVKLRKVAMMTNTRHQRMLRSIADANVKGMPRMRFSWTMVRL